MLRKAFMGVIAVSSEVAPVRLTKQETIRDT